MSSSSGEGRKALTQFGPLERANLNHPVILSDKNPLESTPRNRERLLAFYSGMVKVQFTSVPTCCSAT
jgi:hypothetical protein